MIETRITIAVKAEITDTETNEKKGKNPLPYTLIIKEGKTGTSGLEYKKVKPIKQSIEDKEFCFKISSINGYEAKIEKENNNE